MKTFLQTAALLALLLTARAASSSPPNQPATAQPVGVQQVGEYVYLVRVSNPTQQRASLQLVRLTDGAVLYQELSSRPSFGQKLNVGNLADGQYAVVVKLGAATHRYTLQLRTTTQRSSLLSLAELK